MHTGMMDKGLPVLKNAEVRWVSCEHVLPQYRNTWAIKIRMRRAAFRSFVDSEVSLVVNVTVAYTELCLSSPNAF